MSRASVVAVAVTLAVTLAFGAAGFQVARAGDGPDGSSHHRSKSRSKSRSKPAPTIDPRTTSSAQLVAQLATQLAAEVDTLTKTQATVAEKLAAAEAVRVRRLHAALRILHARDPGDISADERMATARRHAAVRLLLERDASERALLAAEDDHLRAAQRMTTEATAKLAAIALPTELGWPAVGKVTRRIGEYQHERSKATLSRRGLDLEVDDHVDALAPADGTVRYVGPIRGLDFGVILDHGDYLTVVAKLAEPAIPIGAHVARGDHIGRALHHRVYLEVRVKIGPGGLPIDPEPLLTR